VAVIQGSDEAANGKVQLKDLILGAKLAEDATLEEWKSQPAQTEVDRGPRRRRQGASGPAQVTPKSDIRAEAEALQAVFTAAGAVPVDAPLMLSADTLLDLYGEDIRARAYTTHDPDRGEMMLRPDFTVPVVEMHAEHGSEPARYTYLGEVFRKQPVGSGRPSEYLQLGFELFDRAIRRRPMPRSSRCSPKRLRASACAR
jgi:histidyl-tRNA synthetase